MSLLSKFKNDPLFLKILRSSGSLFSNNTLALGLSVLQGVMATRLLGPAGFGLIGVVMAFASTVNSLFSFRMSELVVRYGGEYLERDEKYKAAAVIKAAGLTEAFVSLIAFLVVVLTAHLAEAHLAKTEHVAWMFTIFALGLLANFNTETSTGVLQITDRIKLQGTINLAQAVLTTLIITGAFFFNGSITIVLVAYLVGKSIIGLGLFTAAQIQLHKRLGNGWWRAPFSVLTDTRELIRFAFSSNISATIIKLFRESELIWVGFFLDTTAVGYYRVAYTIVHFLAIPADPLIATTFPEINRFAVEKAWNKLKSFLKRITAFSFAYNLALGAGLILFGQLAIRIYSGADYLAAYPALVALTIGLVFNYMLFWNRPLLLSLGLPEFPIYATLAAGIIKLALSFWLVPRYGIVAAGALLSFYYIASVGAMVWRGLHKIKQNENRTHH
ncbi:MAG: oligosaccharide flippase family protein [Anaerolineales bacterium]|nr:oligosaccharide flippase family protein [Anaerolineales bacterium]